MAESENAVLHTHPCDDTPMGAPDRRSLAASEADHRIANSLGMISALIRLRAAAIVKAKHPMDADAVAHELQAAASEIDVVARLHRLLSRHPDESRINVCDYLAEVCQVLSGTPSFSAQVSLTHKFAHDCEMPRDRVLPIALIVNEVITNAAKYAHPSGVAGEVKLACGMGDDGRLNVSIADDGVGFPDGFDPATGGGVGFRVVRALSDQLGAQHGYRSGPLGMTFSLQVPM